MAASAGVGPNTKVIIQAPERNKGLCALPAPLLANISAFVGNFSFFPQINKVCRDATRMSTSAKKLALTFAQKAAAASKELCDIVIDIDQMQKFTAENWKALQRARYLPPFNPERVTLLQSLHLNEDQFTVINHFASELALQWNAKATATETVPLRCVVSDQYILKFSNGYFTPPKRTQGNNTILKDQVIKSCTESDHYVAIMIQQAKVDEPLLLRVVNKMTLQQIDMPLPKDFVIIGQYGIPRVPVIIPPADGSNLMFVFNKDCLFNKPSAQGIIIDLNNPHSPPYPLKFHENEAVSFPFLSYSEKHIAVGFRETARTHKTDSVYYINRTDPLKNPPQLIYQNSKPDDVSIYGGGIAIQDDNICIGTNEGITALPIPFDPSLLGKIKPILNADKMKLPISCRDTCPEANNIDSCPHLSWQRLKPSSQGLLWIWSGQVNHFIGPRPTFEPVTYQIVLWDPKTNLFARRTVVDEDAFRLHRLEALHHNYVQVQDDEGSHFVSLQDETSFRIDSLGWRYIDEIRIEQNAEAEAEVKFAADETTVKPSKVLLAKTQVIKIKTVVGAILFFTSHGIVRKEL